MDTGVEAFHIIFGYKHIWVSGIIRQEIEVLDCGVDNDEDDLERVEEGTGGVIKEVYI